jgi:hypothetical protein
MSDQPTPTTDRRYSRSRLGGLDVSLLPGERNGAVRCAPRELAPYVEFANVCPEAIVDTAPDGSGLGVWVLVETGIDEDGDEFCSYEYSGGIV